MNFLAHAHLSNGDRQVLVGNLIADSVKGKVKLTYPLPVQMGIDLHRKIDTFTDNHTVFKHSCEVIYEDARRFSGVVMDIFYDHFLARNWSRYASAPLDKFTVGVYHELGKNYEILPSRVKRILPYMMAQNWLNSYANLKDLSRIFYGMDRRTGLRSGMRHSVDLLERHYDELQQDFLAFYPEMINFVSEETPSLYQAYTHQE
jgi:acyl carrier protein phosphodiesterase